MCILRRISGSADAGQCCNRRGAATRAVHTHDAVSGPALWREPPPAGSLLHRQVGLLLQCPHSPTTAMKAHLQALSGRVQCDSGWELSRLPECRSLAEAKQQGVAAAQQHHGKEMSYNNYLDADAAYSAVCDYAGADSARAAAPPARLHTGIVLDCPMLHCEAALSHPPTSHHPTGCVVRWQIRRAWW